MRKIVRRKSGLSLERHLAIGTWLNELQQEITHLAVEIPNAEGVNSKIAKKMDKLEQALSEVRTELENCMFKHHSKELLDLERKTGLNPLSIYYGSQNEIKLIKQKFLNKTNEEE